MKQTLFSYKNNGFWDNVSSYQIDTSDPNTVIPEGYTTEVPTGFYKAKWNKDHWEEGATADEILHWFDAARAVVPPSTSQDQLYSALLSATAQSQAQITALTNQVALLSAQVKALSNTTKEK